MRSLLKITFVLLLVTVASRALAAPSIGTMPIKLHFPIESDSLKKSARLVQTRLHAEGLDQIEVVAVRYLHNYQRSLRKGHYGIYLAAPHYTAWALKEHNFAPIFRLAEPLKYVIAAHRSNPRVFEINDLDNERVCAQTPLNLDYLLVNRAFDKPLHSADIVSVRSVRQEMLEADSPCVGFAISDHYFKEMARQRPGRFIRLQQSKVYNNYALIAHPEIPAAMLGKLRSVLVKDTLRKALKPLFSQFANRTDLIEAKREDYPASYLQPLVAYWGD